MQVTVSKLTIFQNFGKPATYEKERSLDLLSLTLIDAALWNMEKVSFVQPGWFDGVASVVPGIDETGCNRLIDSLDFNILSPLGVSKLEQVWYPG